MKNFSVPVYIFAVTAMVFWGMSFIWTSILLLYFQPITIILIRLIISAAFLFVLLIFTGQWRRIHLRHTGLFLLSAIFNPFFYFLGENYGLKYTGSVVAAVIIATIPLFSSLAGYLLFRERFTWYNLGGMLLSFLGIGVMLRGGVSENAGSVAGVLFLFVAVVSAVLYSIFLKRLSEHYSSLMIIAVQNLIGILLFLPLFWLVDYHPGMNLPIHPEIIISFLSLSILASSLAFVFFAQTIKILGIGKANIFSNLIPVFTALFAFFLLGEAFTIPKIAGMAMVITGVFISEISKKRKKTNPAFPDGKTG